jgi:hypothetical protein
MSYAATAELIADETFIARVEVCGMEQAKVTVTDSTADGRDVSLAIEIIANIDNAGRLVPIVATEPSFSELFETGGQAAISDGMILSAVQQNWHTAALPFVPSPPPTPGEEP